MPRGLARKEAIPYRTRGIIVPMPYPASYFRLSMFRQCRHRYKLHYVDGLAQEYRKPRPYLTMGEHVHGALRDLLLLPVDALCQQHTSVVLVG